MAAVAQNNPTYHGIHLPFPFSHYPLTFLNYLTVFVSLILFIPLVIIVIIVRSSSTMALVEGNSSAPNFLTTKQPAPVSSSRTQPLAQPKCQQPYKMADGAPATVTSLKDMTPKMISLFLETYSEKIYFQRLKVNKNPIPPTPKIQ